MKCQRCGKELTGRQKRWCSQRCSKLGLKAAYKKLNRNKVNSYNRKYRRLNPGGFKYKYLIKEEKCFFCLAEGNLHRHHLNYDKNNVVWLCKNCHNKFHKLLKKSWFYEYIPKI